jgi:hypothetical protein
MKVLALPTRVQTFEVLTEEDQAYVCRLEWRL